MRFGTRETTGFAGLLKLLAVFVIILIIWDVPGVSIFSTRGGSPPSILLGRPSSEWHFRSYFDHFSTAIGMLFALNFPVVENQGEALLPSRQFRAPVAAVLIAGTAMWMHFVGVKDKYTFNARSPYPSSCQCCATSFCGIAPSGCVRDTLHYLHGRARSHLRRIDATPLPTDI